MKQNISAFKIKTANVQKRWFKFTKKLKDYYFNLPILTAAEYEQYRDELFVGNNTHLIDLVDKSIYRIVDAVAQIYANHKVENIVPIEDAAVLAIEHVAESLETIQYLPPLLSEYLHSTISLLVYRKLDAIIKKENFRLSKIEILDCEEMEELLKQKEDVSLINGSILKENFNADLLKVLELLTPKQKELFCFRYGITTGKEMSCAEIGEKLGITREAVHNALKGINKKLNKSQEFQSFKEYNDLNMGL